jgi:hypothetical protein
LASELKIVPSPGTRGVLSRSKFRKQTRGRPPRSVSICFMIFCLCSSGMPYSAQSSSRYPGAAVNFSPLTLALPVLWATAYETSIVAKRFFLLLPRGLPAPLYPLHVGHEQVRRRGLLHASAVPAQQSTWCVGLWFLASGWQLIAAPAPLGPSPLGVSGMVSSQRMMHTSRSTIRSTTSIRSDPI